MRYWKTYPEKLMELVKDAFEGKVVVPDFQRRFIWGVRDTIDLLVSVLNGYFIGTF
jgi:uncharacterized protein with ParB-like and HNH nuclease domain